MAAGLLLFHPPFLGMLIFSQKPDSALDDVSSHCRLCRVSFRSPCRRTSWTCMGIRVCPSKAFPSATPARPTSPTSKGNTPVSSAKQKANMGQKSLCNCCKLGSPGPLCTLALHHFIFSVLPVLPLCMGMLTVQDWNAYKLIYVRSTHVWCVVFFFTKTHVFRAVSQSPAIMHMLDKSGSCGKFENYQRPEGFPVGAYLVCCCAFYLHSTVLFCFGFRWPSILSSAEVRAMAKERQKKDNHNLSEFSVIYIWSSNLDCEQERRGHLSHSCIFNINWTNIWCWLYFSCVCFFSWEKATV